MDQYFQDNTRQLTDKERLIRIEILIQNLAEAQTKFESTLIDVTSKIQKKQDRLQELYDNHVNEPTNTWAKLKYRIVEWGIMALILLAIEYIKG